MKRDNKKALYESIMSAVAKEVKKALNEDNNFENLKFSPLIAKGLNYIKSNESMYNYFKNANITSIEQNDEIMTLCITTDNAPHKIFFNEKFINMLSEQEQAYAILFCCATTFKKVMCIGYEDDVRINKKINHNLIHKWPEFVHMPEKLHLFY